ncbi:MAG: hypothetical protein AABX05_01915 [Nanoarchaeota archaeon]
MTRKDIPVLESIAHACKEGDFGEVVNDKDGVLYLPSKVYRAFALEFGGESNIDSALCLFSCFETFPSMKQYIQKDLGWNDAQFKQAYDKLMKTLESYIPEECLNRKPRRQYSFGALPPPGREGDIGKTAEEILKERRKK